MLGLQDSLLNQTVALPAAASSSVVSPSIDLGIGPHGELPLGFVEFEIDAPAVTTAMLPNGDTITYDVIVSATSNMASPVAVYPAILTQTGAGGVGAPAAAKKFKLPDVLNDYLASARYLALRANTGVGTGNCSTVNATLAVNF